MIHVGGAPAVTGTELRLACSVDRDTRAPDGPPVYGGGEEHTWYEAEVLIDALTHLVDDGRGRTRLTDQGQQQRTRTRAERHVYARLSPIRGPQPRPGLDT